MKKMIFGLVATTAIVFSACKKETTSTPTGCTITGISRSVSDLPADTVVSIDPVTQQGVGAGIKTYYSLETNAIVPNSDSANLNWDIALIGTKIYLNSNNGSAAGAFIYNGDYQSLCSVPDSTFQTGTNAYNALKSWYVYDGANFTINPVPGKVLIIKTVSGKYVKMEILNYYKGGVTPTAATDPTFFIRTYNARYYTFQYTFQPDGSSHF